VAAPASANQPTQFNYRAIDAEGASRSGQLDAVDETSALRELIQRGLTPLHISAVGGQRAPAPTGRRARVTLVDQIVLVQELATLLTAGVSLSESLPSLALAYADQSLGPGLARVDRDLRSGQRLSDALKQSGLALPPYVLALVQAGEASGELGPALADAAAQMEHERRIGQELRNALVYPVVLVLSGIVAVMVIFIGVVPRFASLLKSSRAEVPALSRWVIEGGLFVKQHLLGFGLGTVGLVAVIAFVLASPVWRASALSLAARAPLLGPWLVRVEIGRWATVLGTLLANRVPIIEAIGLSAGALRIDRLRRDLAGAAREIERGRTMADVLAAQGWFPPARLNLIRVGERSGELPRMLTTLGAMETEAARTLQKRVLTLIEPAAILIIGAVIGVIMVAVMMAITSLNTVAA
jgi:general secretion pathway protein F